MWIFHFYSESRFRFRYFPRLSRFQIADSQSRIHYHSNRPIEYNWIWSYREEHNAQTDRIERWTIRSVSPIDDRHCRMAFLWLHHFFFCTFVHEAEGLNPIPLLVLCANMRGRTWTIYLVPIQILCSWCVELAYMGSSAVCPHELNRGQFRNSFNTSTRIFHYVICANVCIFILLFVNQVYQVFAAISQKWNISIVQ